HNNETDEGECSLKLDYSGSPLSIVFNINYLFDVLTSIGSEHIEIFLQDSNKSCLLKKTEKEQSFVNEVRFVVMPMRI
ncbi:MAG: DNA polymerase III subunit beta, partial [Proteobacteria bacterium]|nr:DNA polymerase III subunit beta [Pseudomonadota bacterium]